MHDKTHDNKLTPKQAKAIDALLSGASKGEAATAAGVNPATLYRWSTEDPEFVAALQSGNRAAFSDASRQLTAAMETAVTVMVNVMNNEIVPAAVRLRAAQLVIETAVELRKVGDIQQQLDELKELVQGQ